MNRLTDVILWQVKSEALNDEEKQNVEMSTEYMALEQVTLQRKIFMNYYDHLRHNPLSKTTILYICKRIKPLNNDRLPTTASI